MDIRRAVLSAAAASALLLAGCGQQQITADELVSRIERTRAETQDVHATVAISMTTPDESGRIVVEAWGRAPQPGAEMDHLRVEVRESSEAGLVGATLVQRGEQFWLYLPGENTVVTGTKDAIGAGGELTEDPIAASEALRQLLDEGLAAVDVTMLGSERVANQDSWKVRLAPNAETRAQLSLSSAVEATMWVDKQRSLPLRLDVDARDLGSGSIVVQSITTNTGLQDSLFQFTLPAGATVVDADALAAESAPRQATLDEARAAVGFAVLAPKPVPAGVVLTEVRMLGTRTVIQNYSGAGTSFSVVASADAAATGIEPPAGSAVEQVQVRGQAAELISASGTRPGTMLRWTEGEVRYIVAGPIDRATALAIATSLK